MPFRMEVAASWAIGRRQLRRVWTSIQIGIILLANGAVLSNMLAISKI
jgi:hypothetical protein